MEEINILKNELMVLKKDRDSGTLPSEPVEVVEVHKRKSFGKNKNTVKEEKEEHTQVLVESIESPSVMLEEIVEESVLELKETVEIEPLVTLEKKEEETVVILLPQESLLPETSSKENQEEMSQEHSLHVLHEEPPIKLELESKESIPDQPTNETQQSKGIITEQKEVPSDTPQTTIQQEKPAPPKIEKPTTPDNSNLSMITEESEDALSPPEEPNSTTQEEVISKPPESSPVSPPPGPSTTPPPPPQPKSDNIEKQEEVVRQWAQEVLGFSSEAAIDEFDDWSVKQLLGEPKITAYGDSGFAWAPFEVCGGHEWVALKFEQKVYITEVLILESWNPGAIVKVEVLHGDEWEVIWEDQAKPAPEELRVFMVQPQKQLNYLSDSIKIHLDTSNVGSEWNELAAVQVVGRPPRESTSKPSLTRAITKKLIAPPPPPLPSKGQASPHAPARFMPSGEELLSIIKTLKAPSKAPAKPLPPPKANPNEIDIVAALQKRFVALQGTELDKCEELEISEWDEDIAEWDDDDDIL
eukprot:TRINITY_DN11647_c0_g1_i1.p1 TRINITY_DN11647_c0_g1~~TRINITY_DN11647_c0_g1_i1.p1  ORF type:complete len:550 (+),score=205.84 TRINITY_DN11647_c0_g1_i1:71-1651(+)